MSTTANKSKALVKALETIEALQAKETLTAYDSQRLVNASKKVTEKQPAPIYKAIKHFHNTKLDATATTEEKIQRNQLRAITGGKFPTFSEWIDTFPKEGAKFNFWTGLTAVRKACAERKKAVAENSPL